MTRALGMTSAAVIVLSLLPVSVDAQHRAPRPAGVQGQHRVQAPSHRVHGQSRNHHFHHRSLGSRLVIVAPFVPFGYDSTSVVYAAPPVYYAPQPVVYPSRASYGPGPSHAATPAPTKPAPHENAPMQRELADPSCRYLL